MPPRSAATLRFIRDHLPGVVVAWLVVAIVWGTQNALGATLQGNELPMGRAVRMAMVQSLPWIDERPGAHVARAALFMLLWGAFVVTIDNFLRPILLSGRTQMNGLLVFVSLLGGIAAFGFLGLVLGPVVIA